MTYRPDIDGLRAISILAVVLFHAGFGVGEGGYVGVDVFFVISGFLITTLILNGLAKGSFTLLGFYERRVRRLLPAAMPVLVATILFAWAFYTDPVFQNFAKSAIAFITHTANWYFLFTTGYFGTHPDAQPLLHGWSLAVEEQFYLLYPLLLMWLVTQPKGWLQSVILALALLSFGYSTIELWQGNAAVAFFSSFSRFWELMAGALIAVFPRPEFSARSTSHMRLAGLILVLIAIFAFNANTPFPGPAALIPVSGAVLLLAANPAHKDFVARTLEWGPIVYLGKISYGWFLWHWPVFGMLRMVILDPSAPHEAVGIPVSLALASLSYHLLEKPIRMRQLLPRGRAIAALLAVTTIVVGSIGLYGWLSQGWPGRFSPDVQRIARVGSKLPPDPGGCYRRGGERAKTLDFCRVGNTARDGVDLLLWGDSHAGSMIPALKDYTKSRDLSLVIATRGDCLPLFGVWRSKDKARKECPKFNDAVRRYIEKNDVRAVLIVARWWVYFDGVQWLHDGTRDTFDFRPSVEIFESGLKKTLQDLSGVRVGILEQVPEQSIRAPSAYLVLWRLGQPVNSRALGKVEYREQQARVDEVLDRIEKDVSFTRISPAQHLCVADDRCIVMHNKRLLYFDDDHLNLAGSRYLGRLLAKDFDRWLGVGSVSEPRWTGPGR